MKPVRLQRRRTKGCHLVSPNGLPIVFVTRPGKWGNPYATAAEFREKLELARFALCNNASFPFTGDAKAFVKMKRIAAEIEELRGKNIACYCGQDKACHGDVLLEVANERAATLAFTHARVTGVDGQPYLVIRAARVDGTPTGFAELTWKRGAGTTTLAFLSVEEAARRHGIAAQLIHEAVEIAKRGKKTVMLLECPSNRPWLKLFYERMGFEQVPRSGPIKLMAKQLK